MSKAKKTAQQLRLMVLTELRSKTPFPEGYDVRIVPAPFLGWEARCIPPKGITSFADCSDSVQSVAAGIAAKYDLDTG
jgi:hypothetical protein